MITLGLTGGIAMGKSSITEVFHKRRIPVWDADKAVAGLYEDAGGRWAGHGEAFRKLAGVKTKDDARFMVNGWPHALRFLGECAGPFLKIQAKAFIKEQRDHGCTLCVLDVPLLLESSYDHLGIVDKTVVVSCSFDAQFKRAMARPKMTTDTFRMMIANQMSDDERRLRADFIIDTDGPLELNEYQVDAVILLARNFNK